jgi:hypothetical protein
MNATVPVGTPTAELTVAVIVLLPPNNTYVAGEYW